MRTCLKRSQQTTLKISIRCSQKEHGLANPCTPEDSYIAQLISRQESYTLSCSPALGDTIRLPKLFRKTRFLLQTLSANGAVRTQVVTLPRKSHFSHPYSVVILFHKPTAGRFVTDFQCVPYLQLLLELTVQPGEHSIGFFVFSYSSLNSPFLLGRLSARQINTKHFN